MRTRKERSPLLKATFDEHNRGGLTAKFIWRYMVHFRWLVRVLEFFYLTRYSLRLDNCWCGQQYVGSFCVSTFLCTQVKVIDLEQKNHEKRIVSRPRLAFPIQEGHIRRSILKSSPLSEIKKKLFHF